jgi:hypothetical protein
MRQDGIATRIALSALVALLAGCMRGDEAGTVSPMAKAAAQAVAPDRFDPFPGRDRVPVRDLFAALAREADRLSTSQRVRDEFRRLMQAHDLPGDDALLADYLRIRIAFEATRAGGLWGLEWRVTDQLPQSDRIWAQWDALPVAGVQLPSTAIAECDELSALFAVVARGMGLSSRSRVGLFWPTSNHTVAVWTIVPVPVPVPAADASGHRPAEVRIVVPTSQIFLDGAQSLGTHGFDPWSQPKIFPYARRDIGDGHTLPAALARHFVQQVRRHAGDPQGLLQTARNRREYDQRTRARDAGEDRR